MSTRRDRTTVQYRVIVGKKDELVAGPDGADVVIMAPLTDVLTEGFDPTVAYMQGKLKSTGSTGALFDLLRSGAVADALTQLANGASRP